MTRGRKLTAFVVAFAMVLAGIVMFDPVSAASKPAKVKSVKVVSRTASSVTLKWKKAKRAKKYQIKYKKIGAKKYKKAITKKRRIKIRNLKSNAKYVFRVRGKNTKYGKFSKKIVVRTKEKSNANNQKRKSPKGFAPNPKVIVNGKTVTIGDSIDSVNRKFKLEKAGLYDTGKYPWNIYEPYTDNFLMVRVNNNKVYGFYTSSRKFACKCKNGTISFGDSNNKRKTFLDAAEEYEDVYPVVQFSQYHTLKKTVVDVYYDHDNGDEKGPNIAYKKRIAGAETIAEYTFNQLRYNEGRSVLDTSQKTTAGKVCRRWGEEWLIKKTGASHFGETSRREFINNVIKKEFPGFIEAAPGDVCMATTRTSGLLGVICGTIYATGTSERHFSCAMRKLNTSDDFGVLSISIGKDPGGEYKMHSIAAFW